MSFPRRLQLMLLGALGLVTVILALVAMPQVRGTGVPEGAGAAPAVTPVLTPRETAEPSTPTYSGEPTESAGPPLTPLGQVAATVLGADTASVLVIGDGTGTDDDEWVVEWAKQLAADRTVRYQAWDAKAQGYRSGKKFGDEPPELRLYNASLAAPDLATEEERVATVWPNADVVVLSYGHRKAAASLSKELPGIYAAVKAANPSALVLVVIQNPDPPESRDVQRGATQAVQAWASAELLPTVDIYTAFERDGRSSDKLVEWDGSPTPAGSELWATTLQEALVAALGA